MLYDEVEVHLVLMVMLLVDEVDDHILLSVLVMVEVDEVDPLVILVKEVFEYSSNEIMVVLMVHRPDEVDDELGGVDIDRVLLVMVELVELELSQTYLENHKVMPDDELEAEYVDLRILLCHMGLHIDDECELRVLRLVLMLLLHEVDEVVDIMPPTNDENELNE